MQKIRSILALAALVLLGRPAFAQQKAAESFAMMIPLAATIRASADGADFAADMTISIQNGEETMEIPGQFAALGDKLRCQLSLAAASQANPGMALIIRQLGLDQVVAIYDASTGNVTMVLPGLKAIVETPIPDNVKEDLDFLKSPKGTPKPAGSESVDGVEFRRTVLVSREGEKSIVWQQTDRRNFPALIESSSKDGKGNATIRTIALERTPPDASRFQVPAQYKKYPSVEEAMKAHMARSGFKLPMGNPKPQP